MNMADVAFHIPPTTGLWVIHIFGRFSVRAESRSGGEASDDQWVIKEGVPRAGSNEKWERADPHTSSENPGRSSTKTVCARLGCQVGCGNDRSATRPRIVFCQDSRW